MDHTGNYVSWGANNSADLCIRVPRTVFFPNSKHILFVIYLFIYCLIGFQLFFNASPYLCGNVFRVVLLPLIDLWIFFFLPLFDGLGSVWTHASGWLWAECVWECIGHVLLSACQQDTAEVWHCLWVHKVCVRTREIDVSVHAHHMFAFLCMSIKVHVCWSIFRWLHDSVPGQTCFHMVSLGCAEGDVLWHLVQTSHCYAPYVKSKRSAWGAVKTKMHPDSTVYDLSPGCRNSLMLYACWAKVSQRLFTNSEQLWTGEDWFAEAATQLDPRDTHSSERP